MKHVRPLIWLTLVLLSGGSARGNATEVYSNAINPSSWRAETSVFSCEMVHSIPFYGEAVFRRRAGEASAFYLRAEASRFKPGEAQLVAYSPVWANQPQREELAVVGMKQGTRPLWLSHRLTERMLSRLNAGLEVGIEHEVWYHNTPAPARLSVSTIGFRDAYDEYLACLSSLIPRNYDQLKRTSLLFPGGISDGLPRDAETRLDHILELVKHDTKVKAFYIDGHTDSVGDRDENLELSKTRAELVYQYLIHRGVPEEWITLRWHGERYPVASNDTAAGRAKNRRVTVRLERADEMQKLELAAEKPAPAQTERGRAEL